ncbi:transcriptional regulator, LysR family [Lachnospiraceae bacterium KM106-2]|nr:transcriptional regulator, LysR family [Lachnospiraceae bacterium KM106-2]
MTTNQLEYFIAVAENLNFTKAAKQFFLSQTAITQQIKVLENSLDTKLFYRTKRHVELTPAGKVFLIEAKAILERTSVAKEKVRVATNGLLGSLRIGYVKSYEHSNLSKILSHFHNAYPNIELTLYRDNADALIKKLNDDLLDLVITLDFSLYHHYPSLTSKKLHSVPLMAVLPSSHPFAGKQSIKRSDLAGETLFIMHSKNMDPANSNEEVLDSNYERGLNPKCIHYSSDIETILMMVSAEMGISILPSYAVINQNYVKNIIVLPLDGLNECIDVTVYWNPLRESEVMGYFFESLT